MGRRRREWKSRIDPDSFLALIDSEGNILGVSGAAGSALLQGANLMDTIREENEAESLLVRDCMDNGSSGATAVTVSQESYTLAYVPFSTNRWEIFLGVSQDYVNSQINLQWRTKACIKQRNAVRIS